jgi:PTS system nitrogen regulatory IIA component
MGTIPRSYQELIMNLKKALSTETITLELTSTSKSEVIEEMVDLLLAAGRIKDRKAALKAIVDREKKMSTGMQNGIAIPHGKSDSVDGLVAALGISKNGIDFESMDQQPARIFIMTLSPVNRTGPHIQFLAEISRLLNSPEAQERVLNATTKEELLEIIVD